MLANDHLKIASAELRKAVDALKRDVADLRNEEASLRRMVDRQIAQMTDEIRLREREMRDGPDTNNGNAQAQIRSLQVQIADRKSQLGNDQRRIGDLIRQKENAVSNMDAQARTIPIGI